MANLLKEVDAFAIENEIPSISENIAQACVILMSEAEGKVALSSDAREWMNRVVSGKMFPAEYSTRDGLSLPLC